MTRFFLRDDAWLTMVGAAIITCFIVDTGNSAYFGWLRSGGFSDFFPALFFALASVALAIMGTWAPFEAVKLFKRGALLSSLVFVILSAGLLTFTQSAGWSAWGVSFSDAAAKREDKSDQRAGLKARIARAEQERAALGVVEPPAGVQAKADLECSITSRRYPDGKGPKCTALLEALAASERAAALDAELVTMRAALREAPKIENPNADVHVWLTIANALGGGFAASDMRMLLTVFVVGLIGFIANFGPALVLLVFGEDDSGAVGGQRAGGPSGGHSGGGGGGGFWQEPARLTDMRPVYSRVGFASEGLQANAAVPPAGGSSPIHITFSGSDRGPQSIPVHVASPPPVVVGEAEPQRPTREAGDAKSPDAPDRPVCRNAAQELVDHLLTFAAACLLDQSGGIVSGADMYTRYQSWAGASARSEDVFHALLAEVAGIDQVHYGTALAYRGVTIRRRVEFQEAS